MWTVAQSNPAKLLETLLFGIVQLLVIICRVTLAHPFQQDGAVWYQQYKCNLPLHALLQHVCFRRSMLPWQQLLFIIAYCDVSAEKLKMSNFTIIFSMSMYVYIQIWAECSVKVEFLQFTNSLNKAFIV